MNERKNESTGESRSSPADWLGPVGAFVGGLATFINALLGWIGDPQKARGASVVVFIVYLVVTLRFAFKARKPVWQWASIVTLFIVTILYSIWVGTWIAVSSPPSPTRPAASNLVRYFDFETSASGWEDIVAWDAHWDKLETIEDAAMLHKRERGVAYVLQVNSGGWLNYTVQYAEPVQADVIVAHFYLPDTPDIEANWVGIGVIDEKGGPWLASSDDSISLGDWTQMVLDLRGQYDSSDVPLSRRPLFIQIAYSIKGRSTLQSDTVLARLDDVAWYQASGIEPVREQRGAGRTLFDFENKRIEGWQVASGRVQTDTITLWSERVYRGKWALKLETQLEGGGDKATLRTTWLGSPPQGGWIAQVYLPDNVPTSTIVWASLFTYSESGWQSSAVHNLSRAMWNTLVWDTHDVDWGKEKEITIGIQIGAEGGSYQGLICIDDIQLFEK